MTKRTIAEWVTVARISQGIGHLFAEGDSDARILAHAFGYPTNVDIRLAREIDVSDDESHPYWGGFKLRLIKLARSISSQKNANNMACLIDSDFSPLIAFSERYSALFQTTFANTPATTFQYHWFSGFLIKAYGITLSDENWKAVTAVLRFCFISRYLVGGLVKPNPAPDVSDYVSAKSSLIVFDYEGYVEKFFKIKKGQSISALNDVNEVLDMMEVDTRHLINSNDLFSLTYAVVRRLGNHGGSLSRDSVKHAFFGAFDDTVLTAEGVGTLNQWIAGFGCGE